MAQLTVDVKQNDGWTEFHLAGTIDESSELPKLAQVHGGRVLVDAAGVTRINSLGVAAWIFFFEFLNKQAAEVVVRRLTPILVLQTSMITNFVGPARVESILIPWACESCDHYTEALQMMANPIPESIPCPKCGTAMYLDDEPDAYFAFHQQRA